MVFYILSIPSSLELGRSSACEAGPNNIGYAGSVMSQIGPHGGPRGKKKHRFPLDLHSSS